MALYGTIVSTQSNQQMLMTNSHTPSVNNYSLILQTSNNNAKNQAIASKYKDMIRNSNVNVKKDLGLNEFGISSKVFSPKLMNITWNEFINLPIKDFDRTPKNFKPLMQSYEAILCDKEIVSKLAQPLHDQKAIEFCKWALSPSGGKVIVGKSWGNLDSKGKREKFDALNCNAVGSSGKNPSCDDSWGDIHIKNWLNNPEKQIQCESNYSSNIECYRNDNTDIYCVIQNLQINFSKSTKKIRLGHTDSKDFQPNFLSTDCNKKSKENLFPFPYLYQPTLSSDRCDYVHEGTVLMYSHDDIRNLGHTMNDIMNVWIMLWLDGLANQSKQVHMLNIDSFKLGHNFNDQPNQFFTTYYKNFYNILKGSDFQGKTLCLQRVLIQPIPPRFFIWESWFTDLPCSHIGPSSLYQRWNLHVRHSYDVIQSKHDMETNNRLVILLIVRTESKNDWGAQRTSRNFLNSDEIKLGINELLKQISLMHHNFPVELIAQDLGKLTFEEQIKLISKVSMMIGSHGAGVSSSMHMSIGTKYCCGVIEIYPTGEFFPIKGHGNMARKMGIKYDRVDVSSGNSHSHGVYVPVPDLTAKIKEMIDLMIEKPSCVLPNVYYDPYFDSLKK